MRRFTRRKTRVDISKEDNHEGTDSTGNTKSPYLEQKSLCQQCNDAGKKPTFRPLVERFLCDSCYKTLFPASAMCESDDTLLSKIGGMTGAIRSISRGKKKGASNNTNTNTNAYLEEEECHACLEHGKFRRCCRKYYCRLCYYKSNACPGCNASNYRSGVNVQSQRPDKMAVVATWLISFSVLLIILALIGMVVVNYMTKPSTVWGHACNGWFPTCEKPVCLDFWGGPASGMPASYEFCTVNASVNKVIGNACIFDPELYRWSDETMGFDICAQKNTNATELLPQSTSSSSSLSSSLSGRQGVYVFEDNFDYWINASDYSVDSILMKSAKWEKIGNAKTSGICGMNYITRPYELEHGDFQSGRNNASLVFSGVKDRYAETMDLDMRYGGRVEFYLKLAPIVENEMATECKTSFEGKVSFQYSTDGGIGWQPIRNYPIWKYRNDYFSLVEEDLPEDAFTNSTRFRWEQTMFDPQRDFWSIDDVRILSFFEATYYDSALYQASLQERIEYVHQKQCEYDTEQCADFPNMMDGSDFRLRTVDIYITLCCMILIAKKMFQDYHRWKNAPKSCQSKDDGSDDLDIPLKTEFRYAKCRSWQVFALTTLCTPLCLITAYLGWHVGRWWKTFYSSSAPSTIYLLLCLSMDFWTVRTLAITVFHFWPFCVERKIAIDATNEDELLLLDTDVIPLINIGKMQMISKQFYWSLFVSICYSGYPLMLSLVFSKALRNAHKVYVIMLHLFGVSALCRSILGPMWAVEVFLSLNTLCSLSATERDELGVSFSRPSVAHTTANSTILSVIIALLLRATNFREQLNVYNTIGFIFLAVFVGTVAGSMIGLLRGLPIVPRICFTKWPENGYAFSHNRKRKQPHLFSTLLSGGVNSCEIYILNVEEKDLFCSLLTGDIVFASAEIRSTPTN